MCLSVQNVVQLSLTHDNYIIFNKFQSMLLMTYLNVLGSEEDGHVAILKEMLFAYKHNVMLMRNKILFDLIYNAKYTE